MRILLASVATVGTVALLAAVEVEGSFAFAREVGQVGHAGLHLECHLILRDARGDPGSRATKGVLLFIQSHAIALDRKAQPRVMTDVRRQLARAVIAQLRLDEMSGQER